MRNLIDDLWHGEVPLWKTFWVFWVVGQNVVLWIFALPMMFVEQAVVVDTGLALLTMAVGLFAIVYTYFILIANWRSANKFSGLHLWKFLVQILVGLSMVGTSVVLVVGIVTSLNFLMS